MQMALLTPAYLAGSGGFDELWAGQAEGELAGHWAPLLTAFQQLGGQDLEARRIEARRLFRENGISYSAFAEGPAASRPWELDPVPFLIPAADWSRIEAGLHQRARLLDLILRDLYGPRHLVRNGMVPAELIFAHRGFLLPAAGSLAEQQAALSLYAADIARGPDGTFRVVADRTQAPAGAGLALETRIATSRILPNLIRSSHVHRLARFFRQLRNELTLRAPHQKVDPRIVVLGQGASDPAYFDHAYLASYLGFPLLEGEDLTVREGHLWLRTIEGLKLVDVVFRRIADTLADSLELDPASQAGIPGLFEVARRQQVSMVNPLGAGVLENPGLLPFLPRICRQFLGEELKLESAGTWWCGEPTSLDHVLRNLDRLMIKPIDRARAAVWGGGLSAAELEQWRDRLRQDPVHYVGQEPGGGATTPALVAGELQPRSVVTRCFVSASGDGFAVMPGGFTRVGAPGEISGGLAASLQGTCKDTWVLAAEDERHLIQWPATTAAPDFHVVFESLPSRTAENLYWVGRNAERAEFLTRLARAALRRFNESRDYGDPADAGALSMLLFALKELSSGGTATVPGQLAPELFESTLLETVRDTTLSGSLAATLKALERSALSVRDRWSADTWRVIDDISETLQQQRRRQWSGLGVLEDTLDRLVSSLVAFTGLTLESTTHEHGWHFMMIGRRFERAANLIRLLQKTLLRQAREGVEHQLLEALLMANESVMTHRRRYRAGLDTGSALQVLVADAANPRSLAYQAARLEDHLAALPRETNQRGLAADQRALLQAHTRIRLVQLETLVAADPTSGQRSGLASFLEAMWEDLAAARAALDRAFFSHVERTQQLVPVLREAEGD